MSYKKLAEIANNRGFSKLGRILNKFAQQATPELWKTLSPAYSKIVAAVSANKELQYALFTGDQAMVKFIRNPSDMSVEELMAISTDLVNKSQLEIADPGFKAAATEFAAAIKSLNIMPRKASPRDSLVEKIKRAQKQLGVSMSGVWDPDTNTAFINWLNAKGFAKKWMVNNRFKGNLTTALAVVLAGNTDTPQSVQNDPLFNDHSDTPSALRDEEGLSSRLKSI